MKNVVSTEKQLVLDSESQRFNKEEFLSSKRYGHQRDLLGVLLEDGERYSFDHVDGLIMGYMKGMVK